MFSADTYSQFMPLFTREAAEHHILLSGIAAFAIWVYLQHL